MASGNLKATDHNAIFVGCSTPLWKYIIKELISEQGWSVSLFVGFEDSKAQFKEEFLKQVPFLNINSARLGLEPVLHKGSHTSTYQPELIAALTPHIDIFMEMLDRFILFDRQPTWEQKFLYFKHLVTTWDNILSKTAASVIVLASRPHRAFDYIIEILGKHRNIPVVTFEHSETTKSVYAVDLRNGLHFDAAPAGEKAIDNREINSTAEAVLAKYRGEYDDAKPVAISNEGFFSAARQAKERKLLFRIYKTIPPVLRYAWDMTRSLLAGETLNLVHTRVAFNTENRRDFMPSPAKVYQYHWHKYKRQKQLDGARKFYQQNTAPADLNSKFVLFPAAYQPERSTCPDAARYHDMLLALAVVSANVPKDYMIFFKEHPRTFALPTDDDAQRALMFYKQIQERFANVRIIDQSCTPFELIDRASAIALSSGTIALEAIARGKHCCLFGDKWFSKAPGILRIYSNSDFRAALQKNSSIETDELLNYFSSLEAVGDDIQYMFESNIDFRKNIQDSLHKGLSDEALTKIRENTKKAVAQIHGLLERTPK